jgi:broad specificity phosphatase PhoE
MPVDAGPCVSCRVILVRHAHTGMAGRFCGQSDPPLSEQGRAQLPELAEQLAKYPLTHVFSSDLLRCRETANFIAAKKGLTVELLPGLRELGFGEWEGLDWDAVSARDREYAEQWLRQYPRLPAPGGEDFGSFRERVRNSFAELADQIHGGCAAVVTHAGVIRVLMLDLLNLPESALAGLECGYACFRELRRESGRWHLQG